MGKEIYSSRRENKNHRWPGNVSGALPDPGRQPRGADAGFGSSVRLLTSPKRSPALLLPPDAAGPAGPGLGPGRGLCRLSERRTTSKVACPAGAGAQRAELGGGGGGREVWGPHEGAPVLRRSRAGGQWTLQEPRSRQRVFGAWAWRAASAESGRTRRSGGSVDRGGSAGPGEKALGWPGRGAPAAGRLHGSRAAARRAGGGLVL